MISESLQEQASLYSLGALSGHELAEFEAAIREDAELRDLTFGLMRAAYGLALSAPVQKVPEGLKESIFRRIDSKTVPSVGELFPGLFFATQPAESGWKPLPIPGAFIKLLSIQKDRGYAVLLGKLEAGTRYPAHVNVGPEDFYVLSGDLHIGAAKLNGGDFHHAVAGSQHEENFSEAGCTLIAVLTTDDPLVAFALA